jgi:hypothetical protein
MARGISQNMFKHCDKICGPDEFLLAQFLMEPTLLEHFTIAHYTGTDFTKD